MHEHIGALILSRRIIWTAVIRPCRICMRASCDIMNLTQGSHEQTILHWCDPQVVAEPTPILRVLIGQKDSTLLTVQNFGNKQRDTSQNGLFSLQHAECLPLAFLLCPSTKILPHRVNGGFLQSCTTSRSKSVNALVAVIDNGPNRHPPFCVCAVPVLGVQSLE